MKVEIIGLLQFSPRMFKIIGVHQRARRFTSQDMQVKAVRVDFEVEIEEELAHRSRRVHHVEATPFINESNLLPEISLAGPEPSAPEPPPSAPTYVKSYNLPPERNGNGNGHS